MISSGLSFGQLCRRLTLSGGSLSELFQDMRPVVRIGAFACHTADVECGGEVVNGQAQSRSKQLPCLTCVGTINRGSLLREWEKRDGAYADNHAGTGRMLSWFRGASALREDVGGGDGMGECVRYT